MLDMVARKILLQLAVQDIGQLTDFGTIVRGPVLPRTGSQLSPHKQDKGDFSRAMLTPPKSGVTLPMGEFWNGTTWKVEPAQSPDPDVTRSTMSSVSCGTSLSCMGVGFFDTSGGVEAPVGEQFS